MKSKINTIGITVLTAVIALIMIACEDKEKNVDASQYYLVTPTGINAMKLTDGRVHITWNAVDKAKEYEICARTNLDSEDTRLDIITTSKTSYEHEYFSWFHNWFYSLPEEVNTIYYYIKAYPRISGYIESDWSDSVSIESTYVLAAPTGVKTSKLNDGRVHITWDAVKGAQVYEICARTNLDSADTRLNITTTSETSYEHTFYYWYHNLFYTLPAEVTTIYYYVRALSRTTGYAASVWSDPVYIGSSEE